MPFGRKKSDQITPEFKPGPSIAESRGRSRKLVVAGILLAISAGVGSYVVLTRAQQSAVNTVGPTVAVVVAARTIQARTPVAVDDLAVRQVPADGTNAQGTFNALDQVVGRTPGVTILQGMMVTSNLFTFSAGAASVAILEPDETVGPGTPDWRAVSIAVPDDRAVGGVVSAGEHVDVFVTAAVNVQKDASQNGVFYGDRTTKVTYQDVSVLSKAGTFYVIKVTVQVAEEIAHLQASGTAQFSLALRPDTDNRAVDAAAMGATTNIFIQRYGLPVPQTYPQPGQALTPAPPVASPTPNPAMAAAPQPAQAAVTSPAPSTP